MTPGGLTLARAPIAAGPGRSQVRASGIPLTIEIRTSVELMDADASILRTILSERPHVGFFASPAWLAGFFAEPSAGWQPCLAMFREGDVLRGMVPLAVRHGSGPSRVTLLGGGLGSDRVDLIAARGYEARCADAFLWWLSEAFGKAGYVLCMRDVPHDSALWGALGRTPAGRSLVPSEIHPIPYLDLRESPSEGEDANTSADELSKSLARHRRWLEARGRLRIEVVREVPEALAAFETLVRFLDARWNRQGTASALRSPARQRFHRTVIPRLLDDGQLRMIRISVDLRTVAVFYGFAASGWWGYYLAGYDRDWAGRIHLGRLALSFAIDLAVQSGASEFDFLKGAEPVKYLWPVKERVAIDADVFAPRPLAQIARAASALREAGTALGKSALSLRPGP